MEDKCRGDGSATSTRGACAPSNHPKDLLPARPRRPIAGGRGGTELGVVTPASFGIVGMCHKLAKDPEKVLCVTPLGCTDGQFGSNQLLPPLRAVEPFPIECRWFPAVTD